MKPCPTLRTGAAIAGALPVCSDGTRCKKLFKTLADDPEGWFVYDPAQELPDKQLGADAFSAFLGEVRQRSRNWADDGRLGFIYVDSPGTPTFVKIFDPTNMGSSCGCSGKIIWPRWIITKIQPDEIPRIPEPAGVMARVRHYFNSL